MQIASKTSKESPDVQLMREVLTFLASGAKYIRLYDGFMGRMSMEVLRGMGIQDVIAVRVPSSIPNTGGTMIMQSANSSFETKEWHKVWAANIGAQVKSGKNIMVFFQFRYETDNWPSMNQMMEVICAVGEIDMNTDTVMHNGGMDGVEKKRILADINMHWKKRVVMTNSAVTAGVDFNVHNWFDRLYECVARNQTLERSCNGYPAPATLART